MDMQAGKHDFFLIKDIIRVLFLVGNEEKKKRIICKSELP